MNMTRDQASRLRELVLHAPQQSKAAALAPLPAIAVCGGRPGVGTTSVAAGLTVALGRMGKRPVLVDANIRAPDVSRVFCLPPVGDIGDVVTGRRTAKEVLQRGPAGIGVVAGANVDGRPPEDESRDAHCLVQQLQHLRPRCDLIVLDAGAGGGPTERVLCQTAQRIVLVTTPDASAVMDLYATIKRIRSQREDPPLDAVVNRCTDAETDRAVHQSLRQTCQRFLGLRLEWELCLPHDRCAAASDARRAPVTLHMPGCPVARGLQQLADQVQRSVRPVPGWDGPHEERPEENFGTSADSDSIQSLP